MYSRALRNPRMIELNDEKFRLFKFPEILYFAELYEDQRVKFQNVTKSNLTEVSNEEGLSEGECGNEGRKMGNSKKKISPFCSPGQLTSFDW